jgi:hypothetical protein
VLEFLQETPEVVFPFRYHKSHFRALLLIVFVMFFVIFEFRVIFEFYASILCNFVLFLS